jgi:hypothetical protein
VADDLEARIEEVAAKPASVTVDGQTVVMPKLPELIAADQYLASKAAAEAAHRGLRITKLIPPGARGREPGC